MHTLAQLSGRIGATILVHADRAESVPIARVAAADKISHLLSDASPETLLVTGLSNHQLARVAELMDAPAICLANGAKPDRELLAAAESHGKILLTASGALSDVRAKLDQALASP